MIVAPTFVYRFYDAADRLLYVGVTDSLGSALQPWTRRQGSRKRKVGDGALYQRASDGLWVASIRERGMRKCFAAKTPEQAQAKLNAYRAGAA